MLERVSAALTKLLTPIASTINNSLDSDLSSKEGFQRHKKKETKKESKADEKAPKSKTNARPDPLKSGPQLTLVPQPEIQKHAGTASGGPSIIAEIFSLFKEQHASMRRWGGAKTYESSLRSKSMSQLRKGTILDENAG